MSATREQLEAARHDPKLANVLYHDYEAASYDDKWSISYDQRCIDYAAQRFLRVAGRQGWPYPSALELGCGTGFFLLNLRQAGVLDRGAVTDISPAMVAVAQRNAERLGFSVEGRVADAEALPFPDASFDLVVGHAVLHHIPDVELALREVLRVLRPGGRFVFAGEPTRYGDFVARRLSRLTWRGAQLAGRLPAARGFFRSGEELASSSAEAAVVALVVLHTVQPAPRGGGAPPGGGGFCGSAEERASSSAEAALEALVDLHTFQPAQLRRLAHRAGAVQVRVVTEELTAAWLGWPVRTFEAAVAPGRLGWGWAMAAYRSWRWLAALDDRVLSKVVPAGLFYNALLTGVRP